MPRQAVESVTYVGEGNSEHWALVVDDKGGNVLDLAALMPEGGFQWKDSVPEEPKTEANADADRGHTWF